MCPPRPEGQGLHAAIQMTQEPGGFALPFPDRRAAGRLLAERLKGAAALDKWPERTLVLALPRGGAAVTRQIADILALLGQRD